MPKNIKPALREPYTRDEIIRILAACDRIGRNAYERIRARAMVLLLRYTGLRISDVAILEKERVRDGEIHLYTAKNGRPVRLPVHPGLRAALDRLPRPRAAAEDCKYFFWSGHGSKRCIIRNARRTLAAFFEAPRVENAQAHRFRHTLATEILEKGHHRRGGGHSGQQSGHHPKALCEVVPEASATYLRADAEGLFWYKFGTREKKSCK